LPNSDWTTTDQAFLKQALIGRAVGEAPAGAGAELRARHRLARAIALRDRETLVAAAREELERPSLAASDGLRLARAIAPWEEAVARALWDRTKRVWPRRLRAQVDASFYLAARSREVQVGGSGLLDRPKLPVVTATIDARHSGPFIVDTGAPHSVLSLAWCERQGIVFERGIVHTVDDGSGREIEARAVRIDRLAVGAVARDVPAVILDLPPSFQVAGILSPLDAFAGHPVALDFVARRLDVGPAPASLPFEAGLFWRDDVPLVHARVDGQDGLLMIDSGAGGQVLCKQFAKRLRVKPKRSIATLSASGPLAVGIAAPRAVAVGASPECLLEVAVKPCRSPRLQAPLLPLDGFLGADWMAGRRLAFAADRRIVAFS
jgi:hypothetical protein